jgi:hypothetical protein
MHSLGDKEDTVTTIKFFKTFCFISGYAALTSFQTQSLRRLSGQSPCPHFSSLFSLMSCIPLTFLCYLHYPSAKESIISGHSFYYMTLGAWALEY